MTAAATDAAGIVTDGIADYLQTQGLTNLSAAFSWASSASSYYAAAFEDNPVEAAAAVTVGLFAVAALGPTVTFDTAVAAAALEIETLFPSLASNSTTIATAFMTYVLDKSAESFYTNLTNVINGIVTSLGGALTSISVSGSTNMIPSNSSSDPNIIVAAAPDSSGNTSELLINLPVPTQDSSSVAMMTQNNSALAPGTPGYQTDDYTGSTITFLGNDDQSHTANVLYLNSSGTAYVVDNVSGEGPGGTTVGIGLVTQIVPPSGSVPEVLGSQLTDNSDGSLTAQEFGSDGDVQYTQTTTTASNGQIMASISGSGDIANLSDASVSLASGAQAAVDGADNAISLAAGAALTLGAADNTVTVNGNGASVNMSVPGATVGGDTVTVAGTQENLAFGTTEAVDVASGLQVNITGTDGTMTASNGTTSSGVTNTIAWNAGGSQIQYLTPGITGVGEAINNYTGANGTGTFLDSLYDYLAGNSTDIFVGNLASGDASIFKYYTGENDTGTFFRQDTNYTAGNSLLEFFNPTNTIATEFQDFTGASGTGTDTQTTFNWDAGGSQIDYFNPGISGVSQADNNYTGANGTGTLIDSMWNYNAGNSEDIITGNLPSGDASVFDYYAGLNEAGKFYAQDTNYTAGNSLFALFSPTSSIATQLEYYSGSGNSGTYQSNLIDWAAGGSQDNYYTSLPSNWIAATANYAGANNTGVLLNSTADFNTGTSSKYITGDLPSGVSMVTDNFAGENDTGLLGTAIINNTNNTSIDLRYVYSGTTLDGILKTFFSGSTDLGVGAFTANDQYASGYNGGGEFNEDDGFDGDDGFDDDGGGGEDDGEGDPYGGGYELATSAGTTTGVQTNSPLAAQAAQAALQETQFAAQLQAAGSSLADTAFFEDAKWSSKVITWSLGSGSGAAASPFSSTMGTQYEAVIQNAFAAWGAASGLTFVQVADSSNSDIRLGWGDLGTASSGVVGYTSFQNRSGLLQPNVIIRLEDPSETSLVSGYDGSLTYSGTQASLYQVIVHEIGHALGLADNGDPNSVMYYQAGANSGTLDSNDILGMNVLYKGATAPTFAAQASNLTPAQMASEASINSMIQQLIQAGAAAQSEASAALSLVPPHAIIAPTLAASQHA